MRQTEKQALTSALITYFQTYFTAKATQYSLEDIKGWQSSYPELISGMDIFPACQLAVTDRRCSDGYFTEYTCTLKIGLIGDESTSLYQTGSCWEEIVEGAIRDDWTLGGTVVQVHEGFSVQPYFNGNFYGIECDFTVDAAHGGIIHD